MKPEKKEGKGKALSRREFLKNSAIGVAGVAAGSLLGARTGIAQKAAQKPIKIGLFGACSGRGGRNGHRLVQWGSPVGREDEPGRGTPGKTNRTS